MINPTLALPDSSLQSGEIVTLIRSCKNPSIIFNWLKRMGKIACKHRIEPSTVTQFCMIVHAFLTIDIYLSFFSLSFCGSSSGHNALCIMIYLILSQEFYGAFIYLKKRIKLNHVRQILFPCTKDNCHINMLSESKDTENKFLDYILPFQRNLRTLWPFASWIFPGTVFGPAFLKSVRVTFWVAGAHTLELEPFVVN